MKISKLLAFVFGCQIIAAFDYEASEIPFYSFGYLFTSELASGIHFEFNFTLWAEQQNQILQEAYNFEDSKECVEKIVPNSVFDCFPPDETEMEVQFWGTKIEELSVISHQECFQHCMKLNQCEFVSLRPQKPWTASPVTMLCILQNNFESKSAAGSYISAVKQCRPRNDTFQSCNKNFNFEPHNPIHRLFQRKKQDLEIQLNLLFQTILDMDPNRLYAGYDVVSRKRKKRKIDFSINLDLVKVTKTIFSGISNLFHLPTLNHVLKNQVATIHQVQLNSNRTQVLLTRSKKQESQIKDHDKDHQLINLSDILDLAAREAKDMIQAMKEVYRGFLNEHLVSHKIANMALDKIQYQLSTIGLQTLQQNSLDLFTHSKTDFFFVKGIIHLFSHMDTYSEKNSMELFKLANLPISVNKTLFNIDVENHLLAKSEALTDQDSWFLVLDQSDFKTLTKIGKEKFLIKNPSHKRKAGQTCLVNLFLGHSMKDCDFQSIPEEKIQQIYVDYLTDDNLAIFTPNRQLMGTECSGQFVKKEFIIGYSLQNPPHLCNIIVSEQKFSSRLLEFNITFESRSFKNESIASLFASELKNFANSTADETENISNLEDMFQEFNSSHHEMNSDREYFEKEIEQEVDDNEETSGDNRIAIIFIFAIMGLFGLYVCFIQLKNKFCCCCNKQPNNVN